MSSRFRVVRAIDFPDLEQDRARHKELALERLKKENQNLIEALGIEVLSHDPKAPATVRIPPLPEYEFVYALSEEQPEQGAESEQGDGEQQGEGSRGGQGQGMPQEGVPRKIPQNREVVEGKDLQRGQHIGREQQQGQQQQGQQQQGRQQGDQQGQQQKGQQQLDEQRPLSSYEGRSAGKGIPHGYTFETTIDVTDIARKEFEDLKLPNLREVSLPFFEQLRKKTPKGHRKRGPWSLRNMFRSARERLTRVSTTYEGDKKKRAQAPFWEDDIRFRYKAPDREPATNIVVVVLRDKSYSIDNEIRRWMLSFLFDLVLALRGLYHGFEIVFIVHDVAAQVSTERDFFRVTSSGGTKCSSGIVKTTEELRGYPPEFFNRVVIYLSDGENAKDDMGSFNAALFELLLQVDFFGYLELRNAHELGPAMPTSELTKVFRPLVRRFPHLWEGPLVFNKESLVKAVRSLIQFAQERGGNDARD